MEVLLCDLAGPSYHGQERQLLTRPQSSLSCLYSLILIMRDDWGRVRDSLPALSRVSLNFI